MQIDRNSVTPSSLKVLNTLSLLAHAREPMGLSEIAAGLGVPRPTAHRLLAALVDDGWVKTIGRPRRYAPTWRIVEAGFAAASRNATRAVILEVLRDVAQRVVPYTLLLAFHEAGDVIITDAVEVRSGRVISRLVGSRLPAAISSAGRVYLAQQGEAEIEHALCVPVAKRTDWTKVNREEILHELLCARARGFSFVDRELDPTSSGISVPVISGGQVVAMLSLSAIPGGLDEQNARRLAGPLLDAASAASMALGQGAFS